VRVRVAEDEPGDEGRGYNEKRHDVPFEERRGIISPMRAPAKGLDQSVVAGGWRRR